MDTGERTTSSTGCLPGEVDALSARLQHPIRDPHGDPIPTAEGEVTAQRGVPLTIAPLNEPLAILHLEDDPKAAYAELIAMGFHPGLPVRLVEASPDRVRLAAGGGEHVLVRSRPPASPWCRWRKGGGLDGRLGTAPRPPTRRRRASLVHLAPLPRGGTSALPGPGVLPGTVIRAEMRSPNGDPTAYRIRDALIALRAEQADLIRIERLPKSAVAVA